MKNKKLLLAFLSLVMLVFVLVGCDNDDTAEETDEPDTGEVVDENGEDVEDVEDVDENGEDVAVDEDGLFPAHIEAMINPTMDDSGRTAVEGGILQYAQVMPSPFEGILNPLFSRGVPDQQIGQFFYGGVQGESLLTVDENFMYTQDGAATFEVEDGRIFTFTIRDNVYWHDGEPVTARDWQFAFEVMGDMAYTEAGGVRFGQNNEHIIVGMMDYREGDADEIEGIRVLEDRVLQIEFEEAVPSLMNSGIWSAPLAYHIFGDMTPEEMVESPEMRTEAAIGFGPFIIDTIVPGESVTFVRNEDYWQGPPVLEGVVLRVVHPDVIAQELRIGAVDVASTFPEAQFPYNQDLSNVTFLAEPAPVYNYIGFKLGYFDGNENVVDPDLTMANVELRRAMWHAYDSSAISESFHNNIRWDGHVLVPPSHPGFHAGHLARPELSFDIANQILDDAGFIDSTGDGYRDNPDGSPLEINFWSMEGDETATAIDQFIVQSWEAIGLNINLTVHEFNAFYDMIEEDYPGVDVFFAAWSTGWNPSPYGLYGRTAVFNYSRYSSDELDRLLALIDSAEANDFDVRQQAFFDWQEYMNENIPVFPTQYRFSFAPINNRVFNYSVRIGDPLFSRWDLVSFSAEEPYED